MDNKLSELSKPVAYDYQIADACIADGHNENGKWVDWNNKLSRYCPPDWMVEEGKVTELKPLYSQEYVSALRADTAKWFEAFQKAVSIGARYEERIAELEAIKADASQVFKEIGNELGCNPDNESIMMAIDELKAQVKVWESAATKHLARAEEAEQRIAELSDLETHNECLIKKNSDLTQQNIKLGERLATPARLTEERTLWAGEDDYDTGHVKGWNANRIEQAALLKKQGFTVEGDEQ